MIAGGCWEARSGERGPTPTSAESSHPALGNPNHVLENNLSAFECRDDVGGPTTRKGDLITRNEQATSGSARGTGECGRWGDEMGGRQGKGECSYIGLSEKVVQRGGGTGGPARRPFVIFGGAKADTRFAGGARSGIGPSLAADECSSSLQDKTEAGSNVSRWSRARVAAVAGSPCAPSAPPSRRPALQTSRG